MPKPSKFFQNTLTALGVLALLGVLIYCGWRVDPEKIREWQREAPVVPFFIALTLLPLIGVPPPFSYLFRTLHDHLNALCRTPDCSRRIHSG